ncbi:hypothetical protein SCLCIDRAFT_1213542 [Scleroderma citrinum Foug A]|uniref:peptidylprolyl isomerase n=1 Tax=Scleroderma citrinum Foug A TaxID=1036808 RepID=A0A0C3E835_9AGAM|nr:hypothetical protein SCLCIDRAFT_1213542 [Scleroderma citrinum Foug A]
MKGFVAQGGDITRHDGSGGESIYGGKFNDEKQGLAIKPHRGSLAMANSGKNTNTSQFFVVLTDEEKQLAKMKGKHVVFGELREGWEVLTRIEEVTTTDRSGDGNPRVPVWIGGCGTCLP